MSGYWAYGSPNPSSTTSTNVDPLGIGSTRVRSDLSIIPRNNFYGDSFQSLDLRVSKDLRIGRLKFTGIAQVFNLYNHAQYRHNTVETSPVFKQSDRIVGIGAQRPAGIQGVLLMRQTCAGSERTWLRMRRGVR